MNAASTVETIEQKLKDANIPFRTQKVFEGFWGTRFYITKASDASKAESLLGFPVMRHYKEWSFAIY